jgi:hypothetical protein
VTEIDDLAREIATIKSQVQTAIRSTRLTNSSVEVPGGTDTVVLADTVDQVIEHAATIPGLQEMLDSHEDALAENRLAVQAAQEAATQAGADGIAAGELASAAADDALDKAQEALDAAAAAGGGATYTGRAPTSDDPGVDGQQWFVWDSNYKISAYYVYSAAGWVQTEITDAVLGNIDAGSITSGYLGAERIAAASLTAAVLAADTLTSREIGADAILARNIKALQITATHIAASTITGDKIAANTITAGNIAAGTITANEIAAGTITATEINLDTLNGKTITGATVQTAPSGKRAVLGGSLIRFYDANNLQAGQIEGVSNGAAGGVLRISPDGSDTVAIFVGAWSLPLGGTAAMRAPSLYVSNHYIDTMLSAATGKVIGGDTDWRAVPNGGSGYTGDGAGGYRVKNGDIRLRGQFNRPSGSVTAGDLIGLLPAGARPPYRSWFLASTGTGGIARCYLDTNGQIYVSSIIGTAGTYLIFEQKAVATAD